MWLPRTSVSLSEKWVILPDVTDVQTKETTCVNCLAKLVFIPSPPFPGSGGWGGQGNWRCEWWPMVRLPRLVLEVLEWWKWEHLSLCLYLSLPGHPSIHPSIHPSPYLFIYACIHLSLIHSALFIEHLAWKYLIKILKLSPRIKDIRRRWICMCICVSFYFYKLLTCIKSKSNIFPRDLAQSLSIYCLLYQ